MNSGSILLLLTLSSHDSGKFPTSPSLCTAMRPPLPVQLRFLQDYNALNKEPLPPPPPCFHVHSFCKTLTASDTSTHGGFSVLRPHADECLPPLDMSRQPPPQELVAKDLHGNEWRFRHIFRGVMVFLRKTANEKSLQYNARSASELVSFYLGTLELHQEAENAVF